MAISLHKKLVNLVLGKPLILENLNSKDEIQNEHREWVRRHFTDALGFDFNPNNPSLSDLKVAPAVTNSQTGVWAWIKGKISTYFGYETNFSSLKDEQYDILNYPSLWSGVRSSLFETRVEKKGEEDDPASETLSSILKNAKKKYKDEPERIEKINALEKEYKKQLLFLKERALLLAIDDTLKQIGCKKKPITQSELINMQTLYDCLVCHDKATKFCNLLRENLPDKKKHIAQLEVLSKRLVDSRYENVKKTTRLRAILDDISKIAFYSGLAVGVPALILTIVGFFVPPVMPVAIVLSYITFIAYLATTICAGNMLYEAIKFGRAPSADDIKALLKDLVFAPFNLVEGPIFSGLFHLIRNLKHAPAVLTQVENTWDVLSNVFPDVCDVTELPSDIPEVGNAFKERKLDTSTTSWSNMRSALAPSHKEATDLITKAKKDIIELNKSKAKLSHCEQHQEDCKKLKRFLEKKIDPESSEIKEIKQLLDNYFQLESESKNSNYLCSNDYYVEVINKINNLARIDYACNQIMSKPNQHDDNNKIMEWCREIRGSVDTIKKGLLQRDYLAHLKAPELSSTTLKNRDFAYAKVNTKDHSISVAKSKHGYICNLGHFKSHDPEIQRIKKDHEAYKKFKPDDVRRYPLLKRLNRQCENYLKKNHSNEVRELKSLIEEELGYIKSLNEHQGGKLILLGFAAKK